ncbi:MAG: molybdopterin molybdotransferase MoeA [Candidatus Eremiobacteraeota bacterium]|nr:molybdopterin molybdotransferase MoeA [Candidatus Eremiobacteraeota bacterium]
MRTASTVRLPITQAEGRILSGAVHALEDVPSFRRSRVDGYAVLESDVRGASRPRPASLRLSGEVLMGAAAGQRLSKGEAMRVPTGGALPEEATGVVMVEDTKALAGSVLVYDGAECETHISAVASDVRAGERLFTAGTVLSPAALGLLAGSGIAQVDIYEPPSIAVLVTGDELSPPGAPLRPGHIRDINGVALSAALSAMGFMPRLYANVPDERAPFEAQLRVALSQCDGVVISGGSSVGEKDFTPDVVAAAGEPGVVVHGIRAKPGRPALLGMIGEQPVFGLPGNPVSALTVLEAIAKPLLLRMFGKTDDSLPMRASLSHDVRVEEVLEHRIPVRLRADGGSVFADPLLGTSAQMHILGQADGMFVIPIGAGAVAAGTMVDVLPFTRSRTLR